MERKLHEKKVVEMSSLPRDRIGLVIGRHVLSHFLRESRFGNTSYRLSVEPSERAAHHFFIVDKSDERGGMRTVLKQVSYPSADEIGAL